MFYFEIKSPFMPCICSTVHRVTLLSCRTLNIATICWINTWFLTTVHPFYSLWKRWTDLPCHSCHVFCFLSSNWCTKQLMNWEPVIVSVQKIEGVYLLIKWFMSVIPTKQTQKFTIVKSALTAHVNSIYECLFPSCLSKIPINAYWRFLLSSCFTGEIFV